MKKRFLQVFFVTAITGFVLIGPLHAQSISYYDGGSGCFDQVNTLTLSGNDGGTPVRNTFTGQAMIPASAPTPYDIQVIFESGSWKLQVFDGGWNTIASSAVTTYPNPPNLAGGSWADVGDCEPLTQFDGTGTQAGLPISLVSANATVQAQSATLHWVTAQEINNDRFVIEEQTPQGWKNVGEVLGQGTTIEQNEYTFTVSNLSYGTHTFRIAQYDRNGGVNYSRTMQVKVELADAFALSDAYPNPFNPSTNFTLAVAQTQHVQIKVYDLQGREIATLHNGTLDGQTTHLFRFDAQSMSSGRYLVRVQGEQFTANKQVVLAK